MAIPTSYTEATLKAFMHAELREVATALGWTVVAGSYDEPLIETLLAYGVSDIVAATDIRKLRALARREVWRAVASATAGDHDFSAEGASYSRSQIHAQALAMLTRAESDAGRYDAGGGYAVTISKTHYADPYQRMTMEEREALAEAGEDLT
jgi:hypothetical protein